MKSSRRLKRMDKRTLRAPTVILTSLMDIFIVMVIYLLMNQALGVDVTPPKSIKLPDSIVETQVRQTLMMLVNSQDVVVEGERVATIDEVLESGDDYIKSVGDRMLKIRKSYIGFNEDSLASSTEVTIMADKTVPFKVLKKLMSTSSSAGYEKISLAVNQSERRK